MPVNDSWYEREKRVAVRRNGMKGLTFFKNLDSPVRVIWLIGILFCFFPFIYGTSEEQFESVEGSKDFSVSFAVCTAFALPIIMDGLIERGVAKITGNCTGGQLYYDTCKYKVVMGAVVAVPNFIIMLYIDTPSIYLCFSHLQQVLLCLFVINNVYDISFVRNGISIWDGQTRALLMSLTVAASCFQLLHAVLLTDSLLYLTVISVVFLVAFLGFKVVCWVFECFLENVKHFEDSSGDSYERKCLAYDVLAVSVYVVALLVYVLVNIGVGATHHVGAIEGIKARVYCGALLGVFLALVPAKSRHLKMRAMEDEYHNKRIYVQYVSQEAIHPLNCALQGFQFLVDDASRRSLNNTLSGPGAVAAMAHMAQLSQMQGPGAAAEALASASRITEIRQHCLASKKCLLDLVRFDKFDTGAVLGQREDISMWKFVRAQADYFSTQMYHKRISLRLFSRLNGAAPVEEDDRGISFLGGSYSMSGSAGLTQSFEDIIISDCVKTCTVLGNKHRLAQVFRHLVHNALRFSPLNGDICIVLELKEHPEDTTLSLPRGARRKYADDASVASEDFEASDDGVGQNRKSGVAHTLRVEIRDRGPGVEKAEVGRLFSKRRQRKKEQGGIGLWLCQMIVEMHGGKMGYCDARDEKVPLIALKDKETSMPPAGGLFGGSYPPLSGAVEKIAGAVKMEKISAKPAGAVFFVELPVQFLNPDAQGEVELSLFPARSAKIAASDPGRGDMWAGMAESMESGSMSNSLPQAGQYDYYSNGSGSNPNTPGRASHSHGTAGYPAGSVNGPKKPSPPSITSATGGIFASNTSLQNSNSEGRLPPTSSYGQLSQAGSHGTAKVSDPIPIPW